MTETELIRMAWQLWDVPPNGMKRQKYGTYYVKRGLSAYAAGE